MGGVPTITGSGVGGGGGLVSKRATSAVMVKGIGAVVVIEMFVPYRLIAGGKETTRLLIVFAPVPLVMAAAVPLTVALPTKKGTEVLPP